MIFSRHQCRESKIGERLLTLTPADDPEKSTLRTDVCTSTGSVPMVVIGWVFSCLGPLFDSPNLATLQFNAGFALT